MAVIKLTKGLEAIVDEADYERINKYKWCASSDGYAKRNTYIPLGNGKYKQKTVRMHSMIINVPKGMEVDHINRIKTDYRKCNLRVVDRQQNCINKTNRKDSRSGYKGVYFRSINKWTSDISINGKRKYLGTFNNIIDAINAYNSKAKEYFGEYAFINKI